MNKFAVEGKCPECGVKIDKYAGAEFGYPPGTDTNGDYVECDKCGKRFYIRKPAFTGYITRDGSVVYPAAPTEPLVRACELLAEVVTAEDASDWDSKIANFLDNIAKNEAGTYDAAMDRILARAAVSATVEGYARMLYRCSITLCDAVHEAMQNWDQGRCVEKMFKIEMEMRKLLAAAPPEVKDD